MKIFISQPMTGLDEEEILFTREKEKAKARLMFGDDVEFAPSYTPDAVRYRLETSGRRPENYNWDMHWTIDAMRFMCSCDVVWFVRGWQESKGCKIEHEMATQFGLDVVYPSKEDDGVIMISPKELLKWETQNL